MKSSPAFAFSLLFMTALFLLAHPIIGRKGPTEYWNEATNGEDMPKALKDQLFVHQDQHNGRHTHFVKDFDTSPVNIIYRKHMQTKN